MIVPDVNLLIYAYNTDAPLHDVAKSWWEEVLNGAQQVGIPWIVCSAFVRLMTNSKVVRKPMETSAVFDLIEEWFKSPNVFPLNPGSQHFSIYREMMVGSYAGPNLATGAHIAAIASEYRAEVHSNDSDFGRFTGLKWVNPLEKLS